MKLITIAIDGPSGSGKSTTAKNLAKALDIEYIDTGAMYRAVAYKAKLENVSVEDDSAIQEMLANTDIDFVKGSIYLDGKVVDDKIRTLEISGMASDVSKLPSCRTKLVEIQRNIAAKKSVVMDGRDIGTNVLSNARFKFFITATLENRVRRRYEELKAKGQPVSFEEVMADLSQRDLNDTTRKLNPLRRADDALEFSTDYNDEEAILAILVELIEKEIKQN